MLITASHNVKSMYARRNPGLSVTAAAYSPSSSGFLSPRLPSSHRSLLGHSPPPSPGLPSLLPKHGKKQVPKSSKMLKRLLPFLCGMFIFAWIGARWFNSREGYITQNEVVGGNNLPREPAVVLVTDKNGAQKWTVSIPAAYDFPLRPAQYREICSQAMEAGHHIEQNTKTIIKRHRGYYQKDPLYIDIREAVNQKLLPPPRPRPASRPGSKLLMDGAVEQPKDSMKVCEKSLTFVLETSDPGFGKSLMELWTAYGLAQKEGRAFFLDDTRWPYGNFSSYFHTPPQPSCLPPPPSHIVPCPHNARHIVVSAATIQHTFGHEFNEEFEDPFKMEVQRQHKIFALARSGYEALFKLRDDDAKYVSERIASLYGPVKYAGGVSVALHVRRGDRHPREYQYQKDYIPLTRFLDTAGAMISHFTNGSTVKTRKLHLFSSRQESSPSSIPAASSESIESIVKKTKSVLVLASDDPDIYSASEFQSPITTRAQGRIALASKTALEAASNGKNKNKYIDEISGWEGGFYRDVFWSLGRPSSSAQGLEKLKPKKGHVAGATEDDEEVSPGAMQLRELVGRSYMLDLAVVVAADSVVCTVSSTGCRLLAIMKGWESVGGNQKGYGWKNVDGDWDWKGVHW